MDTAFAAVVPAEIAFCAQGAALLGDTFEVNAVQAMLFFILQ